MRDVSRLLPFEDDARRGYGGYPDVKRLRLQRRRIGVVRGERGERHDREVVRSARRQPGRREGVVRHGLRRAVIDRHAVSRGTGNGVPCQRHGRESGFGLQVGGCVELALRSFGGGCRSLGRPVGVGGRAAGYGLDLGVVFGFGRQLVERAGRAVDLFDQRSLAFVGAVGPAGDRIGCRAAHGVPFERQLVGLNGFGVEFHVRRGRELLKMRFALAGDDDVVEQEARLVGAGLRRIRGEGDARRRGESFERHGVGFEPAHGGRDVDRFRHEGGAFLAHDVVRAEFRPFDGFDDDVAAVDVFAFGIGAGREADLDGRVRGQGRQLGRVEDADAAASAAALDVARTGGGVARRTPALHAERFDVFGRRAARVDVELGRPVAEGTVAVRLRIHALGLLPRLAEVGARNGVVTGRRIHDVAAVDEGGEILRQHDVTGLRGGVRSGFRAGLGRGSGHDGSLDIGKTQVGDPGVIGRFGIEP